MPIISFTGRYHFLSNFHDSPLVLDGQQFLNGEAAFQAGKVSTLYQRKQFCQLPPNKAKALGRRVQLRPDWEAIKDDHMARVVAAKFENKDLFDQLMATGNQELIEGNTWNDKYWGVDARSGLGRNQLGKILMDYRDRFQRP